MTRQEVRTVGVFLFAAAVIAVAVSRAFAQWPPELGLSVEPLSPSDADPIQIHVWQELRDTGFDVIDQRLEITGNNIDAWVFI